MPEKPKEDTFRIIREWIEKAENDLTNAAHTLKLGRKCPTDTVGFHVQQCVEKYLKALLIWYGTDFPRTHDIGNLETLLGRNYQTGLSPEVVRRLTGYATIMRYPGTPGPIPLKEARQAVTIARRIRREVRKLLPQGAIRRSKSSR